MNGYMKVLLLVLMIVYAVSPTDLMPGPIDDLLVLMLGLVASKKLTVKG